MKIYFFKVVLFVIGLFVMALGVAFSVKAHLGVSPISCIPYVCSVRYHLTMGQMTIIFNVILIFLQTIVLRRNFRIFQLIQLPIVFLFGYFTDYTLMLVSGIEANDYVWQFLFCLLSCVTLAFGVFLEIKAAITYLPGEGLAQAIARTFQFEFGKSKIGVDSVMVIVGAVGSLLLLSSIEGVREGTVLAALLVGLLARFYSRNITFLDRWLIVESN